MQASRLFYDGRSLHEGVHELQSALVERLHGALPAAPRDVARASTCSQLRAQCRVAAGAGDRRRAIGILADSCCARRAVVVNLPRRAAIVSSATSVGHSLLYTGFRKRAPLTPLTVLCVCA